MHRWHRWRSCIEGLHLQKPQQSHLCWPLLVCKNPSAVTKLGDQKEQPKWKAWWSRHLLQILHWEPPIAYQCVMLAALKQRARGCREGWKQHRSSLIITWTTYRPPVSETDSEWIAWAESTRDKNVLLEVRWSLSCFVSSRTHHQKNHQISWILFATSHFLSSTSFYLRRCHLSILLFLSVKLDGIRGWFKCDMTLCTKNLQQFEKKSIIGVSTKGLPVDQYNQSFFSHPFDCLGVEWMKG